MTQLRPTILVVLAILVAACSEPNSIEFAQVVEASQASDNRPNIVLIVADDLGYSDIAPYGGEIETPNLMAMAEQGIRFSRFYASNTCAPTRSMLLTGIDNHLAGMGSMGPAPNQAGQPGYEGVLNQRVVTLPKLLQDAGYHTYMSGKWHLGSEAHELPTARGFEQSFSLMEGGTSYFNNMTGPLGVGQSNYEENGAMLESLPDDFYATHFYTNRAIEQIESNIDDGKPFFTYLAYTAPHFPLHAPESTIDKYAGRYDQGFNQLKLERFAALKAEGLIPNDAVMPEHNPFSDLWGELTEEQRDVSARKMEVYAAIVDDLDQQIGRVIAYLKEKTEYENTVFIFMSDNGADATSERAGLTVFMQTTAAYDNSAENIGRPGSWVATGHNWAESSMAAFYLYKSQTGDGGVRVPAIVHWPGMTQGATTNHSLAHVTDILPTILELASLEHPGNTYEGREVILPQGKSLAPILVGEDEAVRTPEEFIGIEHWGSRAIVQQDWKLLGLYSGVEGYMDWGLYNISADPGETNNLADYEPEKLQEMISLWEAYVEENGVILAEPGVPALMPRSANGPPARLPQ